MKKALIINDITKKRLILKPIVVHYIVNTNTEQGINSQKKVNECERTTPMFTKFDEIPDLMKNSFLKTAYTQSSMVVDSESGEVMEQDVTTIKYLANNKEHFFIMYASLIGLFQEMTGPETKVYSYMLYHYIFDSEIALPKGMKEVIAEKLNLKLGTVNNAISKLAEKKLIYPTHRGIYKLNPRYAFKGSTKDRNALLKVVLEVECPDC